MANNFKVVTKANISSADVVYTVASSTTAVVLGLVLGNTTSTSSNATVTLTSDTANRAGNNDEANETVELLTATPIPGNSTLEILSGNKVVLEASDSLTCTFTGSNCDVALSVMEIT